MAPRGMERGVALGATPRDLISLVSVLGRKCAWEVTERERAWVNTGEKRTEIKNVKSSRVPAQWP